MTLEEFLPAVADADVTWLLLASIGFVSGREMGWLIVLLFLVVHA